MRYFEDKVPQVKFGKGFNKIALFEELAIQVVRYGYRSTGVVPIETGFFLLSWKDVRVVGGWFLGDGSSFECHCDDDDEEIKSSKSTTTMHKRDGGMRWERWENIPLLYIMPNRLDEDSNRLGAFNLSRWTLGLAVVLIFKDQID